jgi:putative membrane protein
VRTHRADGSETVERYSERRAFALIGALSLLVLAYLFWILYGRAGSGEPPSWTSSLPSVNAALNGTSAVLLTLGFLAIRSGRRELHRKLMLAAVLVASTFLLSYVTYHHFHGDTRFGGEGPIRSLYFFVLVTHVLGSMAALPLVLATLFFSLTGRFAKHRRLARFTFPLWLYVSVTGVLVFLLLSRFG